MTFSNSFSGIVLGTAWSFYVVILNALVGLANSMFIQMLNRVVFSPEWTKEQYKRWVMVSAGLFTLVITPVVGLGIGAPILAIIAALAARDYADWYFDDIESDDIEKAKHDASRLEANFDESKDDKLLSYTSDIEAQELIPTKRVN